MNVERENTINSIIEDAGYAIGYWASSIHNDQDAITVTDHDDEEYSMSMKEFDLFVTAWAESVIEDESAYSRYFVRVAEDIVAEDWDSLDYDAEVADTIIQEAFLGEVIYG